ncbi:hypothetical protein BH23PLA1_BH23PLA1_23740 [soil metagenome]
MNGATADNLEGLFRSCNLGWMIDWFAPPEDAIPYLNEALKQTSDEARKRLGPSAFRLDESTLVEEYHRNPHRVEAFLQVLGATRNPQMLVMTWRILLGAAIVSMDLSYRMMERFTLRIELEALGDTGEHDIYLSDDINDSKILRHIGTVTSGGPMFEGLYSLNLK